MMTGARQRIKRIIEKYIMFVKGRKCDLIIIDDLLPASQSPWRNHEFESLLGHYPDSKVLLDFSSYNRLKGNGTFQEHVDNLTKKYPVLSQRLVPLKYGTSINAKLVYTLFFNNIRKYYQHLKRKNIPFAFTLYPGGGFRFNDSETDLALQKIIADPLCKFVIVNQELSYDYVVNRLGISKGKIFLVFGVPLTEDEGDVGLRNDQKYFSGRKEHVDVVFMSHRYMSFGLDKGFHIFQNTVLELFDDLSYRFHVVGNYSAADLLYPELKERITFDGQINEYDFSLYFQDKDFIVSPNRPNVIAPGAFDGFPLGSSVAGGINNCVMLLTNHYNESPGVFVDNVHYIKINPSHKDIIRKLGDLKSDKGRMKSLAHEARKCILSTYYSETQISDRINIFSRFL